MMLRLRWRALLAAIALWAAFMLLIHIFSLGSFAVAPPGETPVAASTLMVATARSLPRDRPHAQGEWSAVEDDDQCRTARSCLECLFHNFSSRRRGCSWCASTSTCGAFASAQRAECGDVEAAGCPAVLHSEIPQTFRVIYVGIRKGGPEALVQLHLGLRRWGFKSSLDTRHSKKEKGGPLLPFFAEKYKAEFGDAGPQLRWFKSYDDWLTNGGGEGDVLVATETWRCRNDEGAFLLRGARQMQWHLTVWPRRDRAQCTIVGHTRYVAATYMRQSHHALIFPFVSPHIVRLAATQKWRRAKENLLLYDSDTKLTQAALSHGRVPRRAVLATGLTPEQLYELYGKAKAGIDLQLPGGERFVYEAVLFDVCVIVDRALNGLDTSDFPVPERFRVPPGNLTALNAAVDDCIENYDTVIDEFRPLKEHALRQETVFYRHVRRYFSNSVHVVSAACTVEDFERTIVRFLLSTLFMVPFASCEIGLPKAIRATALAHVARQLSVLKENSFLAAVRFVDMTAEAERAICGGGSSGRKGGGGAVPAGVAALRHLDIWARPSRVAYVLWMSLDAVVLSAEIIHELGSISKLLHQWRAAAHAGEQGSGETAVVIAGEAFVFLPSAALSEVRHSDERWVAAFQQRRGAARNLDAGSGVGTALLVAADETLLDEQQLVADASFSAIPHHAHRFFCAHELWASLIGGCE